MSVLVFDGETLAADMALNDGHVKTPIPKIWKLGAFLIGGVGAIHDVSAMKEWVVSGRVVDKFPRVTEHSNFVVIHPTTGLIRYTTKPVGIVHGFNKCAFGSGRDFAYGALYMGANAVDAVKAACKYHLQCGSGVASLSLEK